MSQISSIFRLQNSTYQRDYFSGGLPAKYQDALPLYRQSQIFARHGAEIPRNTLARWMVQAGERVAPLVERLRRHLLSAPLIHMNETTLQVNQEADRQASATSYMWVQRGGPPGQQVVLFDYDASRAGRVQVGLRVAWSPMAMKAMPRWCAAMGSPLWAVGRMRGVSSSRRKKCSPKAKPAKRTGR